MVFGSVAGTAVTRSRSLLNLYGLARRQWSHLEMSSGDGATTARSQSRLVAPTGFPRSIRAVLPWRLRVCFWALALILGFLQVWANRHDVGGDGVNYLDMGDAYVRGDWKTAINGLWSPAYSWILGLALRVTRPSGYWEFTVVHIVGFAVFLVALRCFEFYLTELVTSQKRDADSAAAAGIVAPTWTWIALGYTLFLWACLDLIGLVWVNPDVCVAGIVFLAAGLLLRIQKRAASWKCFALLGLVLGLGYLMKSVMFVIAFIFLAASVLAAGSYRRAMPRVAVGLTIFAALASPLIIALSMTKGRLTIGDAGRLNYAWYVLGVPKRHWRGQPQRAYFRRLFL